MNLIGQITGTGLGPSPKIKKLKLLAVVTALVLSGCASSTYKISYLGEVDSIPDDCANEQFFTRYLDQQLVGGKPTFESQEEYNAKVSKIKTKIWRLRAICHPA